MCPEHAACDTACCTVGRFGASFSCSCAHAPPPRQHMPVTPPPAHQTRGAASPRPPDPSLLRGPGPGSWHGLRGGTTHGGALLLPLPTPSGAGLDTPATPNRDLHPRTRAAPHCACSLNQKVTHRALNQRVAHLALNQRVTHLAPSAAYLCASACCILALCRLHPRTLHAPRCCLLGGMPPSCCAGSH